MEIREVDKVSFPLAAPRDDMTARSPPSQGFTPNTRETAAKGVVPSSGGLSQADDVPYLTAASSTSPEILTPRNTLEPLTSQESESTGSHSTATAMVISTTSAVDSSVSQHCELGENKQQTVWSFTNAFKARTLDRAFLFLCYLSYLNRQSPLGCNDVIKAQYLQASATVDKNNCHLENYAIQLIKLHFTWAGGGGMSGRKFVLLHERQSLGMGNLNAL